MKAHLKQLKILVTHGFWVGRTGKWIVRGIAIYLGLVFLTTGLEWLRFGRIPEQMIHAVGPTLSGKVADLDARGFGKWTSYSITLDGKTGEYTLPGFVANDLLEQGSAPRFDLSDHLREGDDVSIQLTAGSLNPFILALRKNSGETPIQLVDHRTSADRFGYARDNAQAIAYNFMAGALIAPLLVMLLYRSLTRGFARKWVTHLLKR